VRSVCARAGQVADVVGQVREVAQQACQERAAFAARQREQLGDQRAQLGPRRFRRVLGRQPPDLVQRRAPPARRVASRFALQRPGNRQPRASRRAFVARSDLDRPGLSRARPQGDVRRRAAATVVVLDPQRPVEREDAQRGIEVVGLDPQVQSALALGADLDPGWWATRGDRHLAHVGRLGQHDQGRPEQARGCGLGQGLSSSAPIGTRSSQEARP
jgi:hypothetical protein